MSEVGLRVNEVCGLDLDDIKWELGRFGELHVRCGEGSRGSGPRERMVPLIRDADRTLRWFVEDVWGHFENDHTRPGNPLFPSERRKSDGTPAVLANNLNERPVLSGRPPTGAARRPRERDSLTLRTRYTDRSQRPDHPTMAEDHAGRRL